MNCFKYDEPHPFVERLLRVKRRLLNASNLQVFAIGFVGSFVTCNLLFVIVQLILHMGN